ncbi:MAG TPA: helicase-related protein, partial [Acidobacteriota bacterium]|nr:helicase-related protein [Acidobacteriota bacterium]
TCSPEKVPVPLVEQLAEGYQRLDMVASVLDGQAYPKRSAIKRMKAESSEHVRTVMALADQTDEMETLIQNLVQMVEEKRLQVRVYTQGRLHAKAYIFTYGQVFDDRGRPVNRQENGIAIVGSSNLTLAGVTHNTELNVVVHGNQNHVELCRWFDELWNESEEFNEALMQELKTSWAVSLARPYDVYMKTLYTLVKDRLEDTSPQDILWDDDITSRLADFQKTAVRQAVQIIRKYDGGFVSDVVGLGKSYIGAAIVKHFERTEHARPLVICPAPLIGMWERYNEVYQLNARVLSIGLLVETENDAASILNDVMYRDRDFVLVDESHNFRHPDTQRYRLLQQFLAAGKRCCFLTATPRNKSAWDVYHQIKLFHQEEMTDLPVDPPNLREYFKLVENNNRHLPDLLSNILIRRTRNHILRWYGYDAQTHAPLNPSQFNEYTSGRRSAYVMVGGRHQFFPKRELETVDYSIEETYQGLYQKLLGYIGKAKSRRGERELTYARYGLWNYVRKDKQKIEPYVNLQRAGKNLRGLTRILLFKRFESSVAAFRETIRRLLRMHTAFLSAINEGVIPAGEDAQGLLYESDTLEEVSLIDALREVSGRYSVEDFKVDRLRQDISSDISLFQEILTLVEPITPTQDAKLQRLKQYLSRSPLKDGKCLIFTQYADTAKYLYENLNPGGTRSDIEVIFSNTGKKAALVGRFAPKANPEQRLVTSNDEINILIATDVLAEGLNLQDANLIINYDLHWNPVRLIQRFGRIDRIGSDHTTVYAFNFLPEIGIEKQLGLKAKLKNRIQEIHDSVGEDSAILDRSERLNEEAMYAIYEKRGTQLSLFEDEEGDIFDLNEAEELLRLLRKENPAEYERIANLRDGIRSARPALHDGMFVMCQAGRYQQLFLLDEKGTIISRDIPRILGIIRCSPEMETSELPASYNQAVMRVKRLFAEEVKHRQAERDHTASLSQGQRYVQRELRVLFSTVTDEEIKGLINILEKAFRGPITSAVNRELNGLRRNHVVGQGLYQKLKEIYSQHNLREVTERATSLANQPPIPVVIC